MRQVQAGRHAECTNERWVEAMSDRNKLEQLGRELFARWIHKKVTTEPGFARMIRRNIAFSKIKNQPFYMNTK